MPTTNIEPAVESDAGEISELYKTVWTPYLDLFPRDLMENRMPKAGEVASTMDSNEYFLAKVDGQTVGVVRCQFPHGTCHLDRMVVHPDHRGKGIGRALTEFIINLARERGASKVWLDTTPVLEEAVRLYESMGFKEVGFFQKHYWGQDIRFYEFML